MKTRDKNRQRAQFTKSIPLEWDYIDFNTDYEDGHKEGRLQWNSEDGTLEVGLGGGEVNLQIGQEVVVRATNKSGVDIPNGSPVYTTGAQGSRPTIALAKSDSILTCLSFLGVTTEDIDNNESGYVTMTGLVRDIDTSDFTAGQLIYVSDTEAGKFTTTRPASPSFSIPVGAVLFSNAESGIIGVLSRFYPDINRLSDVNIDSGIADDQILLYDVLNGYWYNSDPKFGDISGGNYTEFESDGTKVAIGDATTWTDFATPATGTRRGALSKPDFDFTNIGLLFPQNDTDEIVYLLYQMDHRKKMDSDISFHLHYIQSEETQPTFTMEYKFYNNGGNVSGSWTTLNTSDAGGSKGLFDYTSGDMLQIAEFPMITPPENETVSANLDVKLYRNDNDVTGDVLVKYIDFHYLIDTDGSREEYNK